MKELITEVTSASITGGIPPIPTDDVVLQYENKLSQSIAAKTLSASKKGVIPNFTKEETAYLTKKADEDGSLSEVKVITPDPTITLKKGNTEINIKNAATLVKKMEDLYPKGMTEDAAANINRQPFIKASIDHGMKEEFKKRVEFPVKDVSPEMAKAVAADVESWVAPVAPPDIKTVNKNAYEIRTDVLGMALDWVKFKRDANPQSSVTDEDLLSTANKLYKFVENRR
jgi:hypothetical protein